MRMTPRVTLILQQAYSPLFEKTATTRRQESKERVQLVRTYTDLIETKNGGDTNAPLLRWFPSISKKRAGDKITTGQYVNYQTFSILHFRRLLKGFFNSISIELIDTKVERKLFVSVGMLELFCC